MKKIITFIMSLVALGASAQQPVYLDATKPIDQRVEDALQRMTLDEKIAVIHAQSKFSSPGIKRLGFPDFWTDDGPHGVRPDVLWDEWEQAGQTNDSCVAFPALSCLAATFNTQLARLYGESLGEEALYRDKDMILGPGVNIYRTPLNGRNFEYMGEDPYLASRMVVPYIQGLQSKGVSACVKHYALNNDENFRHQVNVIVSDRALHEIYLPAFKAAVTEGKTWGLMGAYNLYNNQHNCHNDIMLNQILKRDWGYDGVVVSDWGGAHDTEEAIRYGLDMEFGTWTDGLTMGKTNAYDLYYMADAYKQLIREGKYTERELNDKVRRVLRLFFRTTMNHNRGYGFLCSESHYDAARKIAQEGIVLLQNRGNLLPIQMEGKKRILVVGENAIKMMTVGGGSSSLKVQHEILPLDAIAKRCAAKGIECDYARGYVGDTVQSYNRVTVGRSIAEWRDATTLLNEAVEKARGADYVIFVGGLNKSDFQDCEGHDRRDYEMPYGQNEVIKAIADVNPNVVFVCISGNSMALPWVNQVPAIVQGWYGGSETGEAIASILFGEVCPSGKLPYTWYASLNDCGAHATGSFPGTWRASHDIIDERYDEGLYVGYRWIDSHKKAKALFAFGHGLSYTTFTVKNLRSSNKTITKDGQITFTVDVTNTGSREGAETVQLYIHDKKSSLDRPYKELKGFAKIWLKPGETQPVSITIGTDALSFYDDRVGEWVCESGDFEALVGTSSANILQRIIFKMN